MEKIAYVTKGVSNVDFAREAEQNGAVLKVWCRSEGVRAG